LRFSRRACHESEEHFILSVSVHILERRKTPYYPALSRRITANEIEEETMFRIASASLFVALIGWCAPPAAAAEPYPQKPIRLVLPFAPGGGTDFLARTLSERLAEALGVSIIVDNRPGAGGTIGTTLVAKSPPDGYTLLFTSASYTFNPGLYKDLPFDPVRDFKPVTMFAKEANLLAVHPSLPVSTVKDFVALARKRPGEITYGSGGVGSNIHLSTELLLHMAGIRLTHVPYKGGGPATTALMTGEVQVMLPGIQPALPFVKAGRIRVLAVTTKQRSPALPDVPSIDEAGVRGYDKAAWYGLFTPAAVPEAIVARLHQAAVKVLKSPDVEKRLTAQGAIVVGNSPVEFDAFVRAEIAAWAKLIGRMKL
jgi:tripartite-type tricarboxylate transporter receptor subunit TctC